MNRFAYSIFCDDVRHEVSGKTSLIGIYNGALLVDKFPAHIPKICVLMNAVTGLDQPFENLIFKGTLDDEVIFEMIIGKEELQQASSVMPDIPGARFRKFQAMGALTPIVFEKTGALKIQVIADGETLECSGLHIGLAPDGMPLTV